MSRHDFNSRGSFTGNSYLEEEDADPRVGLVNLADVMLVFACGLMLALVAYWNLDVSAMQQVTETDSMEEVENVEELDSATGGDSYQDMGRVYKDPKTGTMYLLSKEDEEKIKQGQDASEVGEEIK